MIACISLALLALGAWRRSIKPLATLLLVVAAMGAHFMGSYRIVIDPTMMVNVLHTDVHEASDLIDGRLLLSVAMLAGLPVWWLWRTPLQPMPSAAQGLHNFAVLTLALCLAGGLLVLNAAPMSVDHAQPQVAALHDQPGQLVLRSGPAGRAATRARGRRRPGHRCRCAS